MPDKKTIHWFTALLVTVLVSGAASSFVSQKPAYYKGVEGLRKATADSKSGASQKAQPIRRREAFDFAGIAKQNSVRLSEYMKFDNGFAMANVMNTGSIESKCKGEEIPIIKGGKITGCLKIENEKEQKEYGEPILKIAANKPKVKVIKVEDPDSCERQGLTTYMGPDKPGLLYGMCTSSK